MTPNINQIKFQFKFSSANQLKKSHLPRGFSIHTLKTDSDMSVSGKRVCVTNNNFTQTV